MVVETHSASSVCAMVRAGVGISVVNPLTALDYGESGVAVRRFSVEVFTVSLIRPLHRPGSALVETFHSAPAREPAADSRPVGRGAQESINVTASAA